jgi:hypothetical protein
LRQEDKEKRKWGRGKDGKQKRKWGTKTQREETSRKTENQKIGHNERRND